METVSLGSMAEKYEILRENLNAQVADVQQNFAAK